MGVRGTRKKHAKKGSYKAAKRAGGKTENEELADPGPRLFGVAAQELASMTESQISLLSLKHTMASGTSVDTKFFAFSRRRGSVVHRLLPIYANSTILSAKSTYFNRLFNAGFREGLVGSVGREFHDDRADFTSEYDYLSDSDLDFDEEPTPFDVEEKSPTTSIKSTSALSPTEQKATLTEDAIPALPDSLSFSAIISEKAASRVVVIPDVAFSTFNALIFYLLTGELNFAPLRSQSEDLEPEGVDAKPWQAPPCSPKSMYRLAEKYGLLGLRERAKEDIQTKLTPENIMAELRSSFTSTYEKIRNMEIGFACEDACLPSVLEGIPAWMSEHGTGRMLHSTSVLTALFQDVCLIAMDS